MAANCSIDLILHKSFLFLRYQFCSNICNIFHVLKLKNIVYGIPSYSCGKVEKYSEKDQRTEAADTMHNIIIPSELRITS